MYSQSHSLTTITYNSSHSYSRLIVTRASVAEEFTITPGSEVPRNTTNNSVESTSTEEMLTHTGWLGDNESIVRCSGTKLLSTECIMLSGVGRLQCGSYIAQEFVAIIVVLSLHTFSFTPRSTGCFWGSLKWNNLVNNLKIKWQHSYIPSSEEVVKNTATFRSSCPLCSCAQTVTVSPSVNTYSGWVSPTMTPVVIY